MQKLSYLVSSKKEKIKQLMSLHYISTSEKTVFHMHTATNTVNITLELNLSFIENGGTLKMVRLRQNYVITQPRVKSVFITMSLMTRPYALHF